MSIVKSIFGRRPWAAATGPAPAKESTWRIIASSIIGSRLSQGRKAALNCEETASSGSTRAGLSSSASWKSESWPK